jgi:hypothetical protein
MAGHTNTRNLVTIVSLGILVGTEVIGVALAAGWAIAGLLGLSQQVGWALMAAFTAVGAYGLWVFLKRAVKVEAIYS